MRRLLLAALGCLWAGCAYAQALTTIVADTHQSGGGPSYTGPGDIVSGATAWYGPRAYSAAVAATGTQNAYQLRRSADAATCTALIGTDGDLDLAVGTPCAGSTVAAWALRYAVTGTIAGTTLTTAGDACTASTTDSVNDGGVNIQEYTTIIVVTSCAAGVGVYTLDRSFTISSPVSMTIRKEITLLTAYDQSGNGYDQTFSGVVFFSFGGTPSGKPCLWFAGGGSSSADIAATSAPISYSAVSIRPATGAFNTVISQYNGGGTEFILRYWTTADSIHVNGTNDTSATATDNVWHAFNGATGVSGFIRVDGTETATNTGAVAGSTALDQAVLRGVGQVLTGCIAEDGIWSATTFTNGGGGNAAAIAANQKTYYGTP